MKKLRAPLIIIAYGIVLCLFYLWGDQYSSWNAGLFCVLTFFPYFLGGAFLVCFFLGRLTLKLKDGPGWIFLIYLVILMGAVYFSECFGEAGASYYDGYKSVFYEAGLWIYPLRHSKIILAETATGYLLGSIYQIVKEKRSLLKGEI